jgi:hypothetical protein
MAKTRGNLATIAIVVSFVTLAGAAALVLVLRKRWIVALLFLVVFPFT